MWAGGRCAETKILKSTFEIDSKCCTCKWCHNNEEDKNKKYNNALETDRYLISMG